MPIPTIPVLLIVLPTIQPSGTLTSDFAVCWLLFGVANLTQSSSKRHFSPNPLNCIETIPKGEKRSL